MFDIWYCPEFPVGAINFSKIVFRPDWDHYRPGLLENIKENGMVNPLILLNHRPIERYKPMWLKCGNNRMWAIRELGWSHVPVIITGECPYEPKEKVEPENIQNYFKDGYAIIDETKMGGVGSIYMRGNALPEEMEYPTVTGGYHGKPGIHDDDSAT